MNEGGDRRVNQGESSQNVNLLNRMEYQMLLQQQQVQLLREQRRGLEFNLTEQPMLTSLLPEKVTNFLIQCEVYEATLEETSEFGLIPRDHQSFLSKLKNHTTIIEFHCSFC